MRAVKYFFTIEQEHQDYILSILLCPGNELDPIICQSTCRDSQSIPSNRPPMEDAFLTTIVNQLHMWYCTHAAPNQSIVFSGKVYLKLIA
jgi:hypothetical protein